MANNTQVNNGTGDVIRDIDRAGVKTPVSLIDIGGIASESVLSGGQKAMTASVPVVVASDQTAIPVSGTLGVSSLPTLPAGTNVIGGVLSQATFVVEALRDTSGNSYTISRANINFSAGGDSTIVALVAAKRILVLSFRYKCNGATTITFKSGGGSVIFPASPETQYSGQSGGWNPGGWMATVAGEALICNSSVAVQVSGLVTYIALP